MAATFPEIVKIRSGSYDLFMGEMHIAKLKQEG